jgi:hypothetical protein
MPISMCVRLDPVQAAAAHDLAVLQVALAPAAVANQQIGQRRRPSS